MPLRKMLNDSTPLEFDDAGRKRHFVRVFAPGKKGQSSDDVNANYTARRGTSQALFARMTV
jgi:hypothetical protein